MINHYLGKAAEIIAKNYLLNKGHILVARNYRCFLGEIDIILLKDTTLVVCEVKYRKNDYESAVAAININKQRKIKKTLEYFLLNNSYFKIYEIRFDVIIITGNILNYEINWLKNTF